MKNTFHGEKDRNSDNYLLDRYCGHLIKRGISQSAQMSMHLIALRFLEWWRQSFVGEEYMIAPTSYKRPIPQFEWADLREAYLRAVCADHQLRCAQRTDLAPFINYLAGSY